MKKFKLIIDASDWKVFGFDALCNKDFYASLASQEIISGAFHEKYDRTISSAASMKHRDNAKQYINEQFNDFFGKPEATEIKWNDMLIKTIRPIVV